MTDNPPPPATELNQVLIRLSMRLVLSVYLHTSYCPVDKYYTRYVCACVWVGVAANKGVHGWCAPGGARLQDHRTMPETIAPCGPVPRPLLAASKTFYFSTSVGSRILSSRHPGLLPRQLPPSPDVLAVTRLVVPLLLVVTT